MTLTTTLHPDQFRAVSESRCKALVSAEPIEVGGVVKFLEAGTDRESYCIVTHCQAYRNFFVLSLHLSISAAKGSTRRMQAVKE